MKLQPLSAGLNSFVVAAGSLLAVTGACAAAAITLSALATRPAAAQQTLTGQNAFTDYTKEHPGVRRKLSVADLPQPYATKSFDAAAAIVPRPEGVWPQALPGFKVSLYASGLDNPRLMRVAPNGDIFLAEAETGKIKVLRGVGADGKASQVSEFATGLTPPFGINFYPAGPNPQWVYVGNTDSIVRFPYQMAT